MLHPTEANLIKDNALRYPITPLLVSARTTQETSQLHAGGDVQLTALGNLQVSGGQISSGQDVKLVALGDVVLTGVQEKTTTGGGNDTTTKTSVKPLEIQGQNVNITGVMSKCPQHLPC